MNQLNKVFECDISRRHCLMPPFYFNSLFSEIYVRKFIAFCFIEACNLTHISVYFNVFNDLTPRIRGREYHVEFYRPG
jgi:hypothetical protein